MGSAIQFEIFVRIPLTPPEESYFLVLFVYARSNRFCYESFLEHGFVLNFNHFTGSTRLFRSLALAKIIILLLTMFILLTIPFL